MNAQTGLRNIWDEGGDENDRRMRNCKFFCGLGRIVREVKMAGSITAQSGRSKNSSLFDHLIGGHEKAGRRHKADCPRGF